MELNKIGEEIDNLDNLSFYVHETNSKKLVEGFDNYSFLIKFPPLSLEKNIDILTEFIKDVRDVHARYSSSVILDDNFKPYKPIEQKYNSILEKTRKYQKDSENKIQAAIQIYQNENPKEKVSYYDILGGRLEL